MKRTILVALSLLAVLTVSNVHAATFSNEMLMGLEDLGWGPGTLEGKTDQGELGVDFELALGTSDYGKTSLGVEEDLDWDGQTDMYLKVELIAAAGASQSIELNPFLQPNWNWSEHKDSKVLGVGESYILHWDLLNDPDGAPNPNPDDLYRIKKYGFQVFTAGDVEEPEAMTATVRVTAIPEPATMGLLSLGGLALLRRRRQ
ncbi:MAG: PEP-CTERM sorting domain-containing protein [Phycisphaerae bacterium]